MRRPRLSLVLSSVVLLVAVPAAGDARSAEAARSADEAAKGEATHSADDGSVAHDVSAAHDVPAADDGPEVADTRPAADANVWAGVEEVEVLGLRPGALPPIPGASTDVLFSDDFQAENKSLADLLSESAGVYVRSFGGPGDRSEVTIRGSTPSQVVVTLDGVRANSILTGGLDLSRLCLPLVDRVEVTRGAGSTREGSGAVGGVVNLVTRAAEAERTTRALATGGAFDTWKGSLLHSDVRGDVEYSAGYCGLTTDGDFEFARPTERIDGVEAPFVPDTTRRFNNDRVQHGGTFSVATPFAGGRVRLSDYAAYTSGGEPGIDSGNGVDAGQTLHARSHDVSNLAQLRFEGEGPKRLGNAFDVQLYHRFERSHFRNPDVVFLDPIDVDVRLQTLGLRAEDRITKPILGQSHELALRVDAAHDSLRSSDQSGRDRPQAAVALAERLPFFDRRVTLGAGVRVDWTDGFDPQVLPSVGLVLAPWPWLRARGQIGRAYRAPSFDELFHPDQGFIRGNPDLSPEDAWNFDAGLELDLARAGPFTHLRLGGGWFRREIDESVVWVLVNPRTIAPINTGSATVQGFELVASIDWTRFLRLSANHTRTDSDRDATGERLPGQARDETFVRLRVGPEDEWKLVAELERVGEILVNEGGSRRLPARTVWNLSASLDLARIDRLPFGRVAKELWLFARIDNLTDQAVRDSISFPQPGRNASAGVELVF